MCLYILESMPHKLITTKHYVVYKRLYSRVHNRKPAYRPPYYSGFLYEPGKLNKINAIYSRKSVASAQRVVESGFHAYRDAATARQRRAGGDAEVIKPCIIPAGSQVFYGKDKEVVSNKLIVFKSIEQLNEWCANNPVT